MVESGEVKLGGRVSCKGGETRRLEKRATYNVIEFLLWLISHIHFIMLSWLCARVYCRNFSLISESMSILTD